MVFPAIHHLVIAAGMLAGLAPGVAPAWDRIRTHPLNPHVLEFRGQPVALRTFADSYSALTYSDEDYIPYLDVLQRDGMNLTRVWCLGFPLGPTPLPARFLQPWPRTTTNGTALDGLGKWDFSSWDEAYFVRLKAFTQAASDRGIVVEFTLFSTYYDNLRWEAGPFHPSNNVQGFGPGNRFDCYRPVDVDLLAVQEAAVRRIVRELSGFDNVYLEIQNEPFWNEPGVKDDQEVSFHNGMLEVIRDEEAGLPDRLLVGHDFPQYAASLSPGFDVINEHYPAAVPSTTIAGAEALLGDHYFRGRVLGLDETHPLTAEQTRLESWMFLLGGGGIYDGLDAEGIVYTAEDPSGDNAEGTAFREAVRNGGTYLDNLHLVAMRRDLSWVTGGIPSGATLQAMVSPGQQHVAYLHHGGSGNEPFQLRYDPVDGSDHSVSLSVTLEAGTWRAVWTRPLDLAVLKTEEFAHAGGVRTLDAVTYQADVALRVDRTGAGDVTPPPSPAGVIATGNADGSISLAWNPVQAADLAFYHLYRAEVAGVPVDMDHRIAVIPSTETGMTDLSATVGTTFFYAVSAVDLSGNESTANRETSATSALRSLPFGGTPWEIPGIIQSEDFDTGGEGLAYHDLNPVNDGGQYRESEGVDIEITTDVNGGFHVACTEAGEWLQYTADVHASGEYILELRVASDAAGGLLHLDMDGIDVTGPVTVPDTGGFASWRTITVPGLQLGAGVHVMRLVIDEASVSGTAGAVNWVSFAFVQHIAPIADAGTDLEVIDQDGNGVEAVTLDASASTAGDSPIVSHIWLRNGEFLASGIHPTLNFGIGEHVIQLVVTDANQLSSTDELVVRVTSVVFINGSFEAGFDGWAASGNLALQSDPPFVATDGSVLVSFNDGNRTPNAVLSQTFSTIPGRMYFLSFDMGVLAYNTNPQRLQVDVTGESSLLSQSLSIARTGSEIIRWEAINRFFVADGSLTTLTFRDTSTTTNSVDLLLDHVSVTPEIIWTLSVESSPMTGVIVALAPPDENGGTGGLTNFNRIYPDSARVSLSAPPSANGYRFHTWLKNGVAAGDGGTISVTMDADYTLSAIYVEGPPIIISQPVDASVALGASAVFHVTAEGVGPLAYQWRFNGTAIAGAISDTFTIARTGGEHVGAYDVVVSSSGGSTISDSAELAVLSTSLINGSFESGFTGWTTTGNLSIQSSAPYVPADGDRLVSFNDNNLLPNGVLSQSFATIPGQTYLLSFDMGVYAVNTSQQRLRVDVGGATSLLSEVLTISRTGDANVFWRTIGLSFVADSTEATLVFRDVSSSTLGVDLLLDHVGVIAEILRTLVVESLPDAGASVAVTPPDTHDEADGITGFSRVYQDATVVTLTAAPPAIGDVFQAWLKDGLQVSDNPVVSVTMDADHTLTAVYAGASDRLPVADISITPGPGGVRIIMAAVEPGLYELQRSRDLKSWEWVSEIEATQAGDLEFIDPGPLDERMFYRIVLRRGGTSG